MFERLKDHGLHSHLGKCKFFQENVEYMGHVIYLGGLGVQQVKVEAIACIPRLMDVSRVRVFMDWRTIIIGMLKVLMQWQSL